MCSHLCSYHLDESCVWKSRIQIAQSAITSGVQNVIQTKQKNEDTDVVSCVSQIHSPSIDESFPS